MSYSKRSARIEESQALKDQNGTSEAKLSFSTIAAWILLGFIAFTGAMLIGIYLLKPLFGALPQCYFYCCVLIAIALPVLRIYILLNEKPSVTQSEADRKDFMNVEELLVNADEVIAVDEPVDGHPTYCYKVDETHVIVLRGVEDYDFCDDKLLTPNSSFRIVRDLESKRILRIDYLGRVLRPLIVLDSDVDEHKNIDGEVFECDWNMLKEGLVRL